jgi:hypothetical protein
MESRTTSALLRVQQTEFDASGRFKQRLTLHAQERIAQRGIRDLQLQLIQLFAVDQLQKGGTLLSRIPERKIAELRAALERCADVAIVKNSDERVITVMHQHRRIRHTEWAA